MTLELKLDARVTTVQDQVAFFERAMAVTTPTDIELRYVDFSNALVRRAAISLFNRSSPAYERIFLWECPVNPFLEVVLSLASAGDLFRDITVCGCLETITPNHSVSLSMLLRLPPRLATLRLEYMELTRRDVDIFCGALRNDGDSDGDGDGWFGCRLRRLALWSINLSEDITDDGSLRALCEGLRHNASLRGIEVGYLRSNMRHSIEPHGRGVNQVLEALSHHPNLEYLEVGFNSESCLVESLPGLQPSNRLKALRLSCGECTTTAKQLLHPLKSYPQLSHVCVNYVEYVEDVPTELSLSREIQNFDSDSKDHDDYGQMANEGGEIDDIDSPDDDHNDDASDEHGPDHINDKDNNENNNDDQTVVCGAEAAVISTGKNKRPIRECNKVKATEAAAVIGGGGTQVAVGGGGTPVFVHLYCFHDQCQSISLCLMSISLEKLPNLAHSGCLHSDASGVLSIDTTRQAEFCTYVDAHMTCAVTRSRWMIALEEHYIAEHRGEVMPMMVCQFRKRMHVPGTKARLYQDIVDEEKERPENVSKAYPIYNTFRNRYRQQVYKHLAQQEDATSMMRALPREVVFREIVGRYFKFIFPDDS